MRHWVWIPHAADPAALQASVNAFLALLQVHGGTVVSVNYSTMGQHAVGPESLFSLCLTYQSDLSPEAIMSMELEDAPAPRPPLA